MGCAPAIGDACSSSTDCASTGERYCDVTQPGGYCTLPGCEPDTCPDDAVCVLWRPEPPHLAERWCMASCGSDGDCRTEDGYRCVAPDDPRLQSEDGRPLARVLDAERGPRFCAAVDAPPRMP